MSLTTSASWPELQSHLSTQLQQGCADLQLPVVENQQELLIGYLQLLSKWNKTYNLTAVRDESEMVIRHLLDSLAIASFINEKHIIDIGTGAGLPGIPMAILFPQRELHLLDSNGKKTRFLFQVKTALGLDNITVHQARVESFQPDRLFDLVLSRAFASLQDMVQGCRHLVAPEGRLLAMKGAYPAQELEVIAKDCTDVVVHPLVVPGLGEHRHLVEITL